MSKLKRSESSFFVFKVILKVEIILKAISAERFLAEEKESFYSFS